MTDYSQYLSWSALDLLALLGCREARGETEIGRRGVMWVAENRATNGGWYALPHLVTPIHSVILKPYQFSSFDQGDSNSIYFPDKASVLWATMRLLANAILTGKDTDVTLGADYYHDTSMGWPVAWGDPKNYINTINPGRLRFYKYAPKFPNAPSAIN